MVERTIPLSCGIRPRAGCALSCAATVKPSRACCSRPMAGASCQRDTTARSRSGPRGRRRFACCADIPARWSVWLFLAMVVVSFPAAVGRRATRPRACGISKPARNSAFFEPRRRPARQGKQKPARSGRWPFRRTASKRSRPAPAAWSSCGTWRRARNSGVSAVTRAKSRLLNSRRTVNSSCPAGRIRPFAFGTSRPAGKTTSSRAIPTGCAACASIEMGNAFSPGVVMA